MDINGLTPSNLDEKPELVGQTLKLIEKAFNYPSAESFAVDFYPLFNKSNFKHCHILISNQNEVIAHIGNKRRTLIYKGQKVPCSLWGGIAVDEKFQGQGLFKQFFNHLLSLESQSTTQILWSGAPEHYYKFGFELKYQQYEYFQKEHHSNYIQKSRSELTKEEINQITSLYNKKNERFMMFERLDKDWDEWLKVSSTKLFIYKNNQKIVSYFLRDKGQDLTNIIHEHFIPDELFSQALNHGNLWTPKDEFKHKNDQVSYLGLFKDDQDFPNLWINGIDSI